MNKNKILYVISRLLFYPCVRPDPPDSKGSSRLHGSPLALGPLRPRVPEAPGPLRPGSLAKGSPGLWVPRGPGPWPHGSPEAHPGFPWAPPRDPMGGPRTPMGGSYGFPWVPPRDPMGVPGIPWGDPWDPREGPWVPMGKNTHIIKTHI